MTDKYTLHGMGSFDGAYVTKKFQTQIKPFRPAMSDMTIGMANALEDDEFAELVRLANVGYAFEYREREKALNEMAATDQELGLYEIKDDINGQSERGQQDLPKS